MRDYRTSRSSVRLMLVWSLALALLSSCALIQLPTNDISGTWEAAGELELMMTIEKLAAGAYSGSMDVPMANLVDIPLEITLADGEIFIVIGDTGYSYAGKMTDASTINGKSISSEGEQELIFKRSVAEAEFTPRQKIITIPEISYADAGVTLPAPGSVYLNPTSRLGERFYGNVNFIQYLHDKHGERMLEAFASRAYVPGGFLEDVWDREYGGKWLDAAIRTAANTGDESQLLLVDAFAAAILARHQPDGSLLSEESGKSMKYSGNIIVDDL